MLFNFLNINGSESLDQRSPKEDSDYRRGLYESYNKVLLIRIDLIMSFELLLNFFKEILSSGSPSGT